MTTEMDKLMEEYKEYIIQDKITNNYDFNHLIIRENIYKFAFFLDDYKEYNNNTYLYFKCLYHCCRKEYYYMLKLAECVVEPNIYNLMGYYYGNIRHDYNLMKKYYIMAIELNNTEAIFAMGNYYNFIEKRYDLMKKYYIMSIELNNSNAMHYLGHHYQFVEKKYDLMKKYYIMAIYRNNRRVAYILKEYCKTIENNEANYYKYIYYPHILILILISLRQKNKQKDKVCKNKIFLPEELYIKIYDEYIVNS